MARFDDEFIKRLKEETDIVALIESYGTKLRPRSEASGEMIGLCPIHDDKNPSLVVNRKKNEWCCLGACGKGGDVFSWMMHAEKVSFRHAVELLSNGSVGKASAGGTKAANVRRLESPIETTAADHELLAQVASYYHARLKQSPDALAYLQKRFITDPEAIERFQIGFSDRTLGLTLPVKQNKSGAEIRQRLQTLGVLKETGHERFRGCVTFPVRVVGGVGEIYGRRIDPKTPENQRHWYLDGRHLGVWNLEAFAACDELILCESVIDALTFWCAGYRNVTTIWGTNGLTSDMLDALKQHEIKRLLIAYDADEAGDNATHAHAERFGSLGIECFRTRVSDGAHDINGCAFLNGGGHADAIRDTLGLLIRNAAWIGSGKPNAAPGKSSMEAAKEKKFDEPDASRLKPAASSKASSLAASIPGVEVAKETQPAASASESEVNRNALAAGSSQAEATPAASASPLTEKQPPVASPIPAAPKEIEAEVKENGIVIELGNRIYRVRGLEKNLAFDVLKLNVMVRRDEVFYVDTFDLYAAKARSVFIREAARELGFDPEVIKRDLGKVLLKLESLQDKHIEDTLAVKDETIELTDKDKAAALELLKQPNLIERILADFDACGVVGEETNKLVGYLAATSRKLDKPLAVVIQSSSAAGKSSLMDAVLKFIPSEEQVGYSAMTGQSLFYMGGMNLQHKILSIAEEEGIAQASYALKLLQSEGQLTIASTGKDPGTGRMETQEYHVEGPVMIFLTTTAIDIDEELLNRCVVLTVDENREQTRAIQTQQRINETLDGMLASKRTTALRKLHQNAQRLLRPLLVVNPFANELRFVDDCARRRRDHMKYLAMIRSIALLHQYQRPIKTATIDDEAIQYVEVIPSDITLANRLSNHVLGNSIDELPPQTRRLLLELFDWVQSECKRLGVEQREFTFSRRMVREALGWNQTQLCIHFGRLTEMDYLLVRRGGRGSTLVYELLYDGRGREGQPTLCGLIDVQKLDAEPTTTAPNLSGSKPKRSGPVNRISASNRGENGPVSDAEKNGKAKETPG